MMEPINLILAYSPAITAMISLVVALVVGVKKIKKAGKDTLDDVKSTNREVLEQNAELKRENAELKRQLGQVMCRIKHIHFIDKE